MIYKFAQELGLRYESQTYFGLMVAIWFVVNELISILENAGRMGVELPEFLEKSLSELKRTWMVKEKIILEICKIYIEQLTLLL